MKTTFAEHYHRFDKLRLKDLKLSTLCCVGAEFTFDFPDQYFHGNLSMRMVSYFMLARPFLTPKLIWMRMFFM